ncbi:hypothetical protein DB30_00053 [Enhygromyxa salina]|uniref:Uncharacterized protein n=2 Tax=Enhygromyxa salina TaxID=215803 RepID=A0A0C1ZPH5_9BACT|nr:hypothetical protein DB30_00053 [Enhygromyxa salina]
MLVALLLLGACTPELGHSPAPLAPSAAALAETAELAAGLDAANGMARGRATADLGGVALSLADATLLQLTGAGSPCTLDEDAKLLVMFEGPEAFALVGDRSPRIVARERDSGDLQCWPISARGRVEPTDFTPTTPQLELALGPAEDHAAARQLTSADLRPELEGAEAMTLELLDAALHLRVTSQAGALLLDWEAGEPCERHEASVAALRREAGVVLVLAQLCDACPSCDHGENRLHTTDEIWWPDRGSPLLAASQSLHTSAEGSMDAGQRSVESRTRESWRLNAGALHHDLVEREITHSRYECADDDESDCCVRESVEAARAASWIYAPSSGAPHTWIVDEASATDDGECE